MADRPEMFAPTRVFSGMVDSKCCGADSCCHGNEIWARRGDPVAYRLVSIIMCCVSSSVDCSVLLLLADDNFMSYSVSLA